MITVNNAQLKKELPLCIILLFAEGILIGLLSFSFMFLIPWIIPILSLTAYMTLGSYLIHFILGMFLFFRCVGKKDFALCIGLVLLTVAFPIVGVVVYLIIATTNVTKHAA